MQRRTFDRVVDKLAFVAVTSRRKSTIVDRDNCHVAAGIVGRYMVTFSSRECLNDSHLLVFALSRSVILREQALKSRLGLSSLEALSIRMRAGNSLISVDCYGRNDSSRRIRVHLLARTTELFRWSHLHDFVSRRSWSNRCGGEGGSGPALDVRGTIVGS